MSQFERDMRRAEKKIEETLEKSIRGAAIEIFGEIIRLTPVDTGRLRLNWQAQLNSPDNTIVEGEDGSKGAAIANMVNEVSKYTLDDESIWFTNNLPYAERVEDGWSQQAPSGMVKVTIKAFEAELSKIARINKL